MTNSLFLSGTQSVLGPVFDPVVSPRMFVKDLPVLVRPSAASSHQVAADVHEVVHPRVVRGQAEAGLAGAVGSCRVGPGLEEGEDHVGVTLTGSEGERCVVTQAAHINVALSLLDQPLHHLGLVGHGGHHQPRGP